MLNSGSDRRTNPQPSRYAGLLGLRQRLLVPGPTPRPPEVLAAAVRDLAHEDNPAVRDTVASVVNNLRIVAGRREGEVLLLAASGTGAIEAAVQNLAIKERPVVVAINGHFGRRIAAICESYGVQVVTVAVPDGDPLDFDEVQRVARQSFPLAFAACVHCETSTGIVNDVQRFASVTEAPIVVDAISTLGASEFHADEWGIDVVVGSAGKALMGPPGLSFVAVSDRALAAAFAGARRSYYFSFQQALNFSKYPGITPWTPPVSLISEFDAGMRVALESGLAPAIARHQGLGVIARSGLKAMGLALVTPDIRESAVLTAGRLPLGISARSFVRTLRQRWNIEVASGIDDDSVLRIGHVGFIDPLDLTGCLIAVAETLQTFGWQVDISAVAAVTACEVITQLRGGATFCGESEVGVPLA